MATTVQIPPRRALEIPSGMTYEEFLDWLDEDTRAEWVDGQVIIMSPASRVHQSIVNFISNLLTLFAGRVTKTEATPRC